MKFHRSKKSREVDYRPALAIRDELSGDEISIPLGLHLLISGTTGSGKTTLLNNLLFALSGHIESGDARAVAIDLKDGVTAHAARGFYDEVASDLDETSDLLQRIRELIMERNEWLIAHQQLEISPSKRHPLLILLIDEALQLYGAIDPDAAKKQKTVQSLLNQILLMGRSAAVMVIAAVQDPRKESFKLRDRFPERIALRLNDKDEAVMALEAEAVKRGAAPWLIPTGKPGRGWYYDSSRHKAIRFQVPHISEDDLLDESDYLETLIRLPIFGQIQEQKDGKENL